MDRNESDGFDGLDGLGSGRRLRPSGGYRELHSFRVATIVYDATVSFCERFIDKRSRTVDQMVQAARSGRQNIAEGSRAAATSSQTELRLTNVARASLDELLLDYEDYLRQRGMRMWEKDDPEAKEVRNVRRGNRTEGTDRTDALAYERWLRSSDSAVVANAIICLTHQANFLLDRQIRSLEQDFVNKGGYSEQLAAARIAERQKAQQAQGPTVSSPACPLCGKVMALRTAKQGKRAGSQFWGCSGYPGCRGTRLL